MLAVHLAVFLVLGLVVAGRASAAPTLVYKTDATEPSAQNKKPAPTITVTVIDGPKLPNLDAYTLKQVGATTPAVKATKMINYIEGDEPVGVVVLIFGDPNYLGAKDIQSALKAAVGELATSGPQGSQGMVMMYGAQPEIRLPAGALSAIADVDLTPKEPAQPKAARELATALNAAMIQLDALKTPRKALVVLGDGIDNEGSTAASGPIRDVGKKLAQKKIKVVSVVVQVDLPALGAPVRPEEPQPTIGPKNKEIPPTAAQMAAYQAAEEQYSSDDNKWRNIKKSAGADMNTLTNGQSRVGTRPGTFSEAGKMLQAALDDRFYLQFPGYDKKTKGGFTWDGKEHNVVLKIDGQEQGGEVAVMMTPKWSPGGGGGPPWLLIILGAVGLGGAGAAVAVLKKKKPAAAGAGAGAPGAAPGTPGAPGATPGGPGAPGTPGGPPPGPAKPARTMFISAGSDETFPMVGWVVYMSAGPRYLKHVKLKQGVTRIGKNTTSDVVIDNDPQVSGDHAIIVMSPDGFVISDNNSSNGTHVNDIKITKQDLMDNDLILMGKSVLKFKSVF